LIAPLAALVLSTANSGGLKNRIKSCQRELKAVLAGLAAVVVVYLAVWYIPNRVEISHMNRHYLTKQILPPSLDHFTQNLQHPVFVHARRITPYHFRHTPALFLLAVFGIVFMKATGERGRGGERERGRREEGERGSTGTRDDNAPSNMDFGPGREQIHV